MRVAFTSAARRDLDEILEYLLKNQPSLVDPVQQRLHAVLEILSRWPESARAVVQRPGVRVASLIHYPYRIYYRITEEAIEVVHIRHTSRRPWPE